MASEDHDPGYGDAMQRIVKLLSEALDLLDGVVVDPNVLVNLELARLKVQDEVARSP